MADFKCVQCGANFPSEEALRSHAKLKITEESPHFAKMMADGDLLMPSPHKPEKPR